MNPIDHRSYFFDAGIRFACQRCGACCTGAPGVVRVNDADIAGIAVYLGLSGSRLVAEYLTAWENGYRVREADDGRCLFYADGCRIYAIRPMQCRTFPFWIANLRSESRWEAISRDCPGIGRGRHYTKEEILGILVNGP